MAFGGWYSWFGRPDDEDHFWRFLGPDDLLLTATASDGSSMSFSLTQSGDELESRLLDSDWTAAVAEPERLSAGRMNTYRAMAVEQIADMADRLFGRSLGTDALWDSPAVDELALAFAAGGVSSIRGGAVPGLARSAPGGGSEGGTAMTADDGGYYWNMPPVAVEDLYMTTHDMPVMEPPPGVMWNDWDDDGDPITAVLDSGPANDPAFSLSGDGSFTYTPPPGWTGSDGFTYHVTDGMDVSDTVAVEIAVLNWAPVAEDDTHYATQHDEPMTVPAEDGVLQNDYDPDGDPFWAVLDTGPTHAQSFALSSDGSFTYTPTPDWAGGDSFTYYPTDGIDDGEIATATIAVMNWPPMVGDDGPYMVATGGSFTADPPGLRENDWDPDGDEFALAVETGPSHGTLTHFDEDLDSDGEGDGGFTYTAVLGYTGADSFTYRADDGVLYGQSGPATVSIDVVLPVPDIDTDSDNDGFVETFSQQEDEEEMNPPGKLLFYNADDDNQNGVPDREETGYFLDPGGQPMADDDLQLVSLSLDEAYADLTGFTLQLSDPYHVELWASSAKGPLQMNYTIGTDQFPSSIWVEGYEIGQSEISWVLSNPAGAEVNRDTVGFTVVRVDLTAFRPQTDPFPRTEVPDDEESAPGAGIRYNGDDDDIDGTPDVADSIVSDEDDLIEVDVLGLPAVSPGVEYRLSRSNRNIQASQNSDKTLPFFVGSGAQEYEVSIDPAAVGPVWVEWTNEDVGAGPATLELTVWDAVHDEPAFGDSILFTPFTSVVVAFGGWGVQPLNPASGGFEIALELYERGYDVHAFCEDDLTPMPPNPPYDEVVSAVDERLVNNVAILGNSYGGGATYVLADQLQNNPPERSFAVPFTAYIDGIIWKHPLAWAQTETPPLSAYHVNYYQRHIPLRGDAVNGAAFNLNVNDTPWGASLVHTAIDNDPTVQSRIIEGSMEGGIEGPHDGLIQRVPR